MRKQIDPNIKAHLTRSAFYVLLLSLAVCMVPFALAQRNATKPEAPTKFSQRTLTFANRVAYQRAIEEVYWRHRIWPKERPDPKPPLDAVMSQTQIEKKVESYLRDSEMLEDYWQRPITAEQLQAEMDRMAEHTKQPEVLRELFEALGSDPFAIAECLARPALTERLIAHVAVVAGVPPASRNVAVIDSTSEAVQVNGTYHLPVIPSPSGGCIDDWTATSTTNAPSARRSHTAVWTGSEMIVWGGNDVSYSNTGGKYIPSTDSWTATSTTNVPPARAGHTAVWTGSEMIVWGGGDFSGDLNTGGKYNPGSDSWTATSTTNAPGARSGHTAVWTGSEMIVWGGGPIGQNTGSTYDPNTDSWTATSTTNAPAGRHGHTAVWTGSEMIVWGGDCGVTCNTFNSGGRYDPTTNSWVATSTTNVPDARTGHTAVWSDSEMIVWGGFTFSPSICCVWFNTGGRYDPSTDTWTATSTANAPSARDSHTGVWTEGELIVWGGFDSSSGNVVNTGGRYDPNTDVWNATSTTNAPAARWEHTAVWSGTEMTVWGGSDESDNHFNTGGRYCAQSGSPTPTPSPTATPTPTPTPTPCTGRCTPTPRPRPTPAPRP